MRDNGRGISAEVLPRIFDLFMQQREGGGGLGIGLTLVKQLVNMHGGRVMAKSAGPGQGSEFSVWLPLRPRLPGMLAGVSEESADPVPSTEPEQTTPVQLNVALVEDNEDVQAVSHNAELPESVGV